MLERSGRWRRCRFFPDGMAVAENAATAGSAARMTCGPGSGLGVISEASNSMLVNIATSAKEGQKRERPMGVTRLNHNLPDVRCKPESVTF
jgi:hypothetical protein